MRRLAMLAFSAMAFAACGPKENNNPGTTTSANRSIYNLMKKNYLWSAQLPSYETSGSSVPTQQYFDEKLRYRQNRYVSYRDDTYGDRFSHIERVSPFTRAGNADMVYDSGFFPVYAVNRLGEIDFLQVCYVTPGSPADGKLKRGDAFKKINGTTVTMANIDALLSASSMSIDVLDSNGEFDRTENISLFAHYDQPIIADIIYDELGSETAYMAYTDFVDASSTGPQGAHNKLREAFGRYKAAGVRNLILDLRFNGGGLLSTAQLLSSLIAPNSDLGETLAYIRDNTGADQALDLLKPSDVPENADIQKLVILTSNVTASASELVMHCLEPFYDGQTMHVFGETTTGKNVGSQTFVNESLGWQITPIMFRVYNNEKVSGYEAGIDPDVTVSQFVRLSGSTRPFFDMGELGDYENEYQLNVAIRWLHPEKNIAPIEIIERGRSTRSDDVFEPVIRKASKPLSAGTIYL